VISACSRVRSMSAALRSLIQALSSAERIVAAGERSDRDDAEQSEHDQRSEGH
jgi:S-adenosylmethionine/arginine decarboxylase-like enzyme